MFVICRASVVRIFYSIYEPTWRLLFGLPDLLDAAPKKIVKFYTCFSDFMARTGFFGICLGALLVRSKGSKWPPRAGPNGALGGVKNTKISPTQKKEAPFARVFLASWNQRPKITKTTLNLQVAGAKPSSAKATCFYCKKMKNPAGPLAPKT